MKKILIVDDDNAITTIYRKSLENEGYTVNTCSDLKSTWSRIELEVPDLMILDVHLPDGNGVDFTEKIKLKYPQIIIIILTAHGSVKDGVRAIKLGAYNYIDKSEPRNHFFSLIQQSFSHDAIQDATKLTYHYETENKIIGSSVL